MKITKEFLATINPKVDPKYSPNLYRFLRRKYLNFPVPVSVFKSDRGLIIGFIHDGDFIGCRVSVALSLRPQTGCFSGEAKHCKVVSTFWDDYVKHGRCAIDPGHKMTFGDEDQRWTYSSNGRFRTCNWCGQSKQRRKIVRTVMEYPSWSEIKKGGE